MYKNNLCYVERAHRSYLLTITLLTAFIAACTTIPTQELTTYQNNFSIAKTSVQEMILAAKIAAENVAQHPDNPDGLHVRQKKLGERNTALDARLAAVELIDEYNAALVSLASGVDPAAIEGNLNNIVEGLGAFDAAAFTDIVESVTPLVGAISQAISVIDDLVKQEKFKEAVSAAQEPVIGIITILIDDAGSIHEIEAQLIGFRQEEEYLQLTALRKRLLKSINTYKATDELTKLVKRSNELIKTLKSQDQSLIQDLQVKPTPGQRSPGLADIETVHTLVDQIGERIKNFNAFNDQILAHETLTEEYRNVLRATSSAFIKLNTAVRTNQRTGTVKFMESMLNLRKAALEYQEAKLQ